MCKCTSMKKKYINTLLVETRDLLIARQLDNAIDKAQVAANISSKEGLSELEIQALLLLSKALKLKSEYHGKEKFGNVAIECLEKAVEINKEVDNETFEVDLHTTLGDVYLFKNNPDSALKHITHAFELCSDSDNSESLIKCWNSFCAYHIKKYEFKRALLYAEKALAEAKELKDKRYLIDSYRSLGLVYSRQHNFSKILPIYNIILALSNEINDVESTAIAYNNIAIAHASKSEYKQALENFVASLEKGQEIDFHPNSSRCLVNIGAIFTQLKNYEVAIEHYQKVLKEYQEVISSNTKAVLMINLGEIYMQKGNFSKSKETFYKCLEFAQSENYKEFTCLAFHHLCKIHSNEENYEEAFKNGIEAKKLFDELGNINGRDANLIELSNCCFKLNRSQDAIHYAEKGIRLAQLHDDKSSEAEGYKIMASIYRDLNDFESAYDCHVRFSEARNFLFEQKNNQMLIDMEIKYETREKEKEIELLKSVNRYQSLLLEKREQFESQNKRLIQANEELKQFTYAVSHDLREPIRMIESYTQILKRVYGNTWDDNQDEFFGYVYEGAIRMRNMLNDLLEFATLGANETRIDEVDVNRVIEHVKQDLKLKIDECSASISYDSMPSLVSNPNLIRLVMQNLISNAIKFRKDDVSPEIKISSQETENQVLIMVEDNGIGIKKEHQERIFKVFQRIHRRDEYDGTGIGLALCNKIVQLLNGRISLTSTPGEGTIFQISLPKQTIKEKQVAA